MTDLIFTDDILIENGDFVLNEAKYQAIEHHFKAEKGQYYQWPLTGIGGMKYLNGEIDPVQLKKDINNDLTDDIFTNVQINIVKDRDNNIISIDADEKE